MPLISVIMPVYNGEKYLRECLDSIAAQGIFDKTELIVIDDGSTDGTPEILGEYAARYANIRVITQENAGVSAARNAGLDAARGEYISFADADDRMYPDMLETLMNAAVQTGADMAVCGMDYPYVGESVIITYPFENNVLMGADRIKSEILPFMMRVASMNSLCTKLFRRADIERNGLRLTPGRKYGEDREFVLNFLGICRGVCFVPEIGYYYRCVEDSTIHRTRTDHAEVIFERYRRDREQFGRLGIDERVFTRTAAAFVAEELAGALHIISRSCKGKARKEIMRGVMENEDTVSFLDSECVLLNENCARYTRLILKMARRKSVAGVRAVMLLMKIRVLVHRHA
ncbi:MAG: glycosyltransferase [Oscillospiraceae bacterium]|nr:glycosyltransferase [Oscillospiraceae bacterium]